VHGHRGCRGLLPENTLPAFLHALALGVEVLELDVIISADQQVVVTHEPWLSARLGTGPEGEDIDPAREPDYNLYQLPYATIRRCRVGEQPPPGFPAQQYCPTYRPFLREVLQATEASSQRLGRSPVRYAVEVKSEPASDDSYHPKPGPFVELVLTELRIAGVMARTTLLSFDERVLQVARVQEPTLALCLLTETAEPFDQLFQRLGFLPDTLGPDVALLSATIVQQLRDTYPALRIVPWTINEWPDLQRVLTWQVDGITTDYPNRLLSLLGRLPLPTDAE